jgi:hypothetical protein
MFVHHVRNFPFLDRAKEKEFWQDKLQTVSKLAILGQAQADSYSSSSNRLRSSAYPHPKTAWKRQNAASLP